MQSIILQKWLLKFQLMQFKYLVGMDTKEFPVENFTEILNFVLLVKVLQKFKKWLFQRIF